jgi:hypothetical protein
MGAQKKNVFISHIHEDDVGLKKVKDLLKNAGMDISDYSINSSNPNNANAENYIKYEILSPRINACSVLLVYITPDTKNSSYVNWEIEHANYLGKRIVGVWANGDHGCDLPEALADYADAVVGWRSEKLLDAINGEDSWEGPDGQPSSPAQIKRYSC